MNNAHGIEQAVFNQEALTRVERQLLQYPDISESELDEVTRFLRQGTVIELSLLALNREAWRKAEELGCKLPKRFSARSREYLAIRAIISATIIVFALSWVIAG